MRDHGVREFPDHRLHNLGLTRIEQAGQTWVTLDPNRTELKTCTMAQKPIICIEIKEP